MKTTLRILLFALILLPPIHVIAQSDCPDAIIVCGDADYSGLNATGVGVQEISPSNACASQEHNSLWLKIQIKDGGTLGFILTPESDDLVVDFDFWLYGPNLTCGTLGTAIRCSTTNPLQAELGYNLTGMNDTETDISEGPGPDGNAWINWITANDDDIYYLVIDRPHGEANFSMQWTGTATFHEIPSFLNPDNIPLEIVQCDDDNVDDDKTAFDLTVFEEMFIGQQTDVALTYHTDNDGMVTGNNPIENPESFVNTSNPQTIYMRLTNTVTGCYDTETLIISIDSSLPVGEPQPLKLCDINSDGIREFNLALNNAAISNGDPNTEVTWYMSEEDAENKEGALPALFQNPEPYISETIWARLEATSGCFRHGITSFTITVLPLPEMMHSDDFPEGMPLQITECDDDGVDDDATAFDLTVYEEMLIGNQTGVALTYHTDTNGMETGDEPIDNPEAYVNTSNPQTIYMRMTNTATGCYTNETLTLIFDDSLPVGEPDPISLCDTDETGIREFDLTQNDEDIANGLPNTAVSYYASEEDAENKDNPLPGLYQNILPEETIWARLETTAGCFRHGITSFTIRVLPLPELLRNNDLPEGTPLQIVKCDDDGIDDGATPFDLTAFEAMLTGPQTGMTFTYHYNDNDMLTGDNPIDNPEAFVNTSSPQTVYLRMVNTATGCFANEPITIIIDPNLPAGEPEPLELCDINGTGIREFDLTLNNLAISNGNPNTIVTHYASLEDAENEDDPLPSLYENQEPYVTETIWARFQNTDGCFGFGYTSFTITVHPLPEMLRNEDFPEGTPLEIVQCDDDGVDDESVAFDLTIFEAMLAGAQANMEFTYHINEDDAETGDNPFGNPGAYANLASPQTVYVRMTNSATDCFVYETITIRIDSELLTGAPQPLALCDDAKNGFREFNLTLNDDNVRNGVPNSTVVYYTSQEDAENETNPLPVLYQNQQAYTTETIWARLDTTEGCFRHGIASFTITILPLPEMMRNEEFPSGQSLEITQCDDDGIHDDSVAFDLTVFEDMLIGNQAGVVLTYHTNTEDMLSGDDPITTPAAFPNTSNPQTVFLRLTNTATGCFETETLTLDINYTLPIGEPNALVLCDTEGDGFRNFDLSENDAAIKDGNSNSIVTYYASEEDAENEVNPLSDIYTNQFPHSTETIWARLENITGCYGYAIVSFTITVLPVPEIIYTVDVADFTQNSNSIEIAMPGSDIANYEFSLDGEIYSDTMVFDGLIPGLYTVYIRSKDGCSAIDEDIPVLNYPKFFTPNGDGVNEVWNVFFLYFFPDAIVNIFDRYGKLIKSYRGWQLGWDGTYNGERLPSTDYWFEIVFANGRRIKGHFAMVR